MRAVVADEMREAFLCRQVGSRHLRLDQDYGVREIFRSQEHSEKCAPAVQTTHIYCPLPLIRHCGGGLL